MGTCFRRRQQHAIYPAYEDTYYPRHLIGIYSSTAFRTPLLVELATLLVKLFLFHLPSPTPVVLEVPFVPELPPVLSIFTKTRADVDMLLNSGVVVLRELQRASGGFGKVVE